ncbi:MAG: hypothetical protein ACO1SV_20875 [Fimbriimonas sp.]
MRIGDTLRRAKGLFIESDEPEESTSLLDEIARTPAPEPTEPPVPKPAPAPAPRRTVEDIVREQPGPNLDEIKVASPTPVAPAQPVIGPDGKVNFNAIYGLAKLPAAAFTAEQVLELLASLPAELPISAKRVTLKVTLEAMSKSMGVNSETVVADASRKLAALAAYSESYSEQAKVYMTKAEAEIANLEAEISRRKQGIEDARARQAQVQQSCVAESDRLDDVLEFFSLDVPPSKYAT